MSPSSGFHLDLRPNGHTENPMEAISIAQLLPLVTGLHRCLGHPVLRRIISVASDGTMVDLAPDAAVD